jgi:glycosyltransferase involved in cell wall biosynthesis
VVPGIQAAGNEGVGTDSSRRNDTLKIVHLSPTHFSPDGCIGGGERFVEELARAMSGAPGVTAVKLVSFGRAGRRERPLPRYQRVILRSWTRDRMTPFSPWLFAELRGADVIHCHQYYVLPTFLAAIQGRFAGVPVFASDLGGGGWTPAYQIDQSRWITAHLPISRYAARTLPGRNQRYQLIHGGVDLERFSSRAAPNHDGSLVFLGRVLPHKGIHFAIESLPAGVTLHVIGPTTDAFYLADLSRLAEGKAVHFHGVLTDDEVIGYLQRAMALVHPTPVDANGSAGVNELFGLALLEAMASGCPVLASRAASLPEIVEDGVSGVLVPPCDPAALSTAILELRENDERWRRLSAAARQRAEQLSWRRAADRCLEIYGSSAAQGKVTVGETTA